MRNIAVAGTGYVGLSTGTCFADMGNKVTCIDISDEKIAMLREGKPPIYEPGLSEMITRNVNAGRLTFTTSYPEALEDAEFIFICVGTPSGVDGEADLQYVRMAAESVAQNMHHPMIVINKSTVPVGTGDWVADIIRHSQPQPVEFAVVSCPEFTREGSALYDFMNPDRVVIGSRDRAAAEKVAHLHLPLRTRIVMTDLRTAEMIKYASNAFLATKISFINQIALICEKLGADVEEVAQGMGFDKRIGPHFLSAGLGYGGSCFVGEETVFTLNSPTVKSQSFSSLFAETSTAGVFHGDHVEVITPSNKRVVAFDLDNGRATVADVQAITRRPYSGAMVTIATSMGRSLKVTADHPVIVKSATGFDVIAAATVAPGDSLLALCDLPPVEPATDFNLIDLLRNTTLADDVMVAAADDTFTRQYEQFAKDVPAEMLRYPHDIKRHNRMSLPLFYYLRDRGLLQADDQQMVLYTAKGAGARIKAIIRVDADLLRLCGYYLAEGFISQDVGRAGALRQRIGFSFHEDESEYNADIRRILTELGLKFKVRNSTHSDTTVVSSRIFAWFVRDVLKCGVRSEDKALPHLAFNAAPDLRFELVRGAFSGDGAVTLVQNGKNMMLEYATVSKTLADGMALLLQSLGIVVSIRERWMNKSTRLAYVLRVSGYTQLLALKDAFGEKHRSRIESVLKGYQRHIQQRGFQHYGAFVTLNVAAVEYEDVETMVYSMETSTGTLIASSGLICHNCFPKDVKALEHMALVHGSHPALLRAVMEINRDMRRWAVLNLRETLGGKLDRKKIGILGLAFKPNTDDIRESAALEIARMLQNEGAFVSGYDPVAMPNVARTNLNLRLGEDAYDIATGADALLICTEWNEFKQIDLARIKEVMVRPVIVDGRNLYDAQRMVALGFTYRAVGRGNIGGNEQ
jgi:UDPglucose 6-dehydrogenase